MRLYKFPPMLGPEEEAEPGTAEWALRVGNHLNYMVRNAGTFGVDRLIPLVESVIKTEPWTVWPLASEGGPCRSADRYFQLCTGKTYKQIRALIVEYADDAHLGQRLDVIMAKNEAVIADENVGGRGKQVNDVNRIASKGNSTAYLLRRLARDRKDILAAYERGEYATATAAARAAGWIKPPPTWPERLLIAWDHCTPEEHDAFLKKVSS